MLRERRITSAFRARGLGMIALALWGSAHAQVGEPILSSADRFHPVAANGGMVATEEASATAVGIEVLRRGGNAVDAAVAVGFALAVTLPRAGNLGGGGFMLVHDAAGGRTAAIDYREMAPAGATRDMFLDGAGNVDQARARYSHLSVAVPGTVSGLLTALREFGTLSVAEVMAPALALAEHGFVVSPALAAALRARASRLRAWPATEAVFYKLDGGFYEAGERLVQKDLAWSLRQIATRGEDAFYAGEIGRRIVDEMARHGGLIGESDLRAYRTVIREPVWGTYRGVRIASMPPPSSGGVHLIQMLNVLEGFPLGYLGHNTAKTVHLMAEAMKHAYADRSKYLGDPDFHSVPVEGLTAKDYAAAVRAKIDRHRATPSSSILPGTPAPYESADTTHFSVMDVRGNAVANTYTINFSFGSGIVAAGTGILLNNEMDDFSAKPGVPNAYGLLGADANAIEARKRPLSSMTPTIAFEEGRAFLVTGTPGGSRIITTTLQVILNVIDHGMNIAAATAAPRVHHQWWPDELHVEEGLSPDTIERLSALGHRVSRKDAMGSVQSVVRRDRVLYGASDPRRPGALAAGVDTRRLRPDAGDRSRAAAPAPGS
jgi:gamma-glutamyltranspeptidase / glutathione hydrolase